MSNIRWSKKDVDKVKKLVKSYNSKIKRLKDRGYDSELLPEKTTYTSIKKKVKDRKELNTEIELLNVFTRKYSEKIAAKSERGAKLPYFMKEQIDIKLKVINEERRKQRKLYENKPKTDRNKPIHKANNNFGSQKLEELDERKFNFKNMSRKELDIFNNSISNYNEKYSEKNELYRENLYKAIRNVMLDDHADRIIGALDQLTTEEIVTKYYTDENMDIDFVYEELAEETKYGEFIESWSSVLFDQLSEVFKK